MSTKSRAKNNRGRYGLSNHIIITTGLCIGERKVFEPIYFATGIVYHNDTEQNRHTKSPDSVGNSTEQLRCK